MVDLRAAIKEGLKALDQMIFGENQEAAYPPQQGLAEEAWENLPITKRSLEWDQEGGLVAIEIRSDGVTGIAIKRTRRIQC